MLMKESHGWFWFWEEEFRVFCSRHVYVCNAQWRREV
jgi:hypothetical protein